MVLIGPAHQMAATVRRHISRRRRESPKQPTPSSVEQSPEVCGQRLRVDLPTRAQRAACQLVAVRETLIWLVCSYVVARELYASLYSKMTQKAVGGRVAVHSVHLWPHLRLSTKTCSFPSCYQTISISSGMSTRDNRGTTSFALENQYLRWLSIGFRETNLAPQSSRSSLAA